MSASPPTDPRSPIQPARPSGALAAFVVAALLAVIVWGWQQDGRAPDRPVAPSAKPLPAPAPPSGDAPARSNLAAYFSPDDYPADAIRKEEQGEVRFVLSVSPEGRPTNCRVMQSSGSDSLDATTCRVLQRRARLDPARNAQGEPVADEVSGTVRWVLPEG